MRKTFWDFFFFQGLICIYASMYLQVHFGNPAWAQSLRCLIIHCAHVLKSATSKGVSVLSTKQSRCLLLSWLCSSFSLQKRSRTNFKELYQVATCCATMPPHNSRVLTFILCMGFRACSPNICVSFFPLNFFLTQSWPAVPQKDSCQLGGGGRVIICFRRVL